MDSAQEFCEDKRSHLHFKKIRECFSKFGLNFIHLLIPAAFDDSEKTSHKCDETIIMSGYNG